MTTKNDSLDSFLNSLNCRCRPDHCVAYVDESGAPHQLDYGPYVIAAVGVTEDCREAVEEKLAYETRKLMESLSEFGIDSTEEFHASKIVQGKHPWRPVPVERKQDLLNNYGTILSLLPIYVNIIVVKRHMNVKIRNWRAIRYHAYKMLVERIVMSSGAPPDRLTIKIDSTKVEDENIKRDLELAIKYSMIDDPPKLEIEFVDSRSHPLIQAADFYAYLMKNVTMHRYILQRGNEKLNLEEPLLKAWNKIRKCPDKPVTKGCGLKIWSISTR